MTPLAQQIYRLVSSPESSFHEVMPADWDDIGAFLLDAKCFDISSCSEMFGPLGLSLFRVENNLITGIKESHLFFQPFPRFCYEYGGWWEDGKGITVLVLAEELEFPKKDPFDLDYGKISFGRVFIKDKDKSIFALGSFVAPLAIHAGFDNPRIQAAFDQDSYRPFLAFISKELYPALAIINSPHVIGREDHHAHKGFQRELRRSHVLAPNAELRPWTKILLDVAPPAEKRGDSAGHRLTGARALHFCRSFLRIKNGKLERVRAHWRGDPALGIVRADYKLH